MNRKFLKNLLIACLIGGMMMACAIYIARDDSERITEIGITTPDECDEEDDKTD